MKSKQVDIFNLCFCGIMIGLSTVLSLFPLFSLPLGGSVTLCSMLPVMLVSYFLGPRSGLECASITSLIQMFLSLSSVMAWGLSSNVLIACLMLDYILAYTAIGLAGVLRRRDASNREQLIRFGLGALLAVIVRFICHFISGVVLFAEFAVFEPAWLYSICYNGSFLGCDFAICLVVGLLAFIPVNNVFKRIK